MIWGNNEGAPFQVRKKALQEIAGIVSANPALNSAVQSFEKGKVVFNENEVLQRLLFLLEGHLTLQKQTIDGTVITVDRLVAGDLVGILSYATGEEAHVTAITTTPVRALLFSWHEFEQLHTSFPALYHLLRELTVENLSQRYRRMVGLHLDLASMNQRLENERNSLRQTIDELERTRNRLVHQAKLATLGQFMAGVAHEINNPAAALISSAQYLEESLSALIRNMEGESDPAVSLWEMGLQATPPDTEVRRSRIENLLRHYPDLPRSWIRRMSSLSEDALKLLETRLPQSARSGSKPDEILSRLLYFESGYSLRSLHIASERISRLVVSLKNYTRPSRSAYEPVDVRQGLRDTLLIVGNRLKSFDVELHLDDVPPVVGESSELNQVWTNLIINACDAMGESGRLTLSCGVEEKGGVFVSIADSGPGVPDEFREKIFDTNFTTKTRGQSYGLGLGLAISQEIVSKHGGVLTVANRPEGGAEFTVVFSTH